MYQTFVPQDSVQQYVTSYGGPYAPSGAGAPVEPYSIAATGPGGIGDNGGPGGPVGLIGGGGFPVNGPGGIPPYGPGFPGGPAGFSVQTGYEGFLVPSFPPPPPPPAGFFDILGSIIPNPRSIVSLFMRSGSYLINALAVLFFGGAVTTAVCTFTPLCTISFAALPFLGLRDTAKTIKDTIGNELTSDRVARAVEFVKNAVAKYHKMQSEVDDKTKTKKVPETNNSKEVSAVEKN